jgi:hypothetical protein
MAKQKVQYTHKTLKVRSEVWERAISETELTRQTLSGFVEIAIMEKIERNHFAENPVTWRSMQNIETKS